MMIGKKEIITGVGSLACAIGIGLIMQNSATAEKRYGGGESLQAPDVQEAPLKDAAAEAPVLDVQQITMTSADFDTGTSLPMIDAIVATAASPDSVLETPSVPEQPEQAAVTAADCTMTANARAVAAAMVDLSLSAPCFPNERVTVHHNGMMFSETTSTDGTLDIRVPALTERAVYVLAFTNGDGVVAEAAIEEMNDYSRAVLQWKGKSGFQIHAREFGAGYGEPGHRWVGAPGEMADAVTGAGGMIHRYGDTEAADPLIAEVYTFPKTTNDKAGNVAISVEAEVTDTNCGLEIEAQALETQADGRVKTKNMSLSVPGCDSVGTFLVLNNLLEDLKVAAK